MAGSKRIELTAERLREVLHYDPETGVFTWLVKTSNRVHVGRVAGTSHKIGYRMIAIDGHLYYAHRLTWFYMTGKWPNAALDHGNLDKDDNRFANLREATMSQNLANTRARSDNTSGLKGVGWDERRGKWMARITTRGKRRHLGRFDCPAAAHLAYVVAAHKHFGEFARSA